MKRRSLFYVINLIFPCLLIYAVSFLGFFLPVDSGEKVNLETTILLALVVFLLIVGETLPPTPDAIPVLGILFGLTMMMVSIALVMSVVVTNIYMRKDTDSRVPAYLRCIFIRKGVNSRRPAASRRSSNGASYNCVRRCRTVSSGSDYHAEDAELENLERTASGRLDASERWKNSSGNNVSGVNRGLVADLQRSPYRAGRSQIGFRTGGNPDVFSSTGTTTAAGLEPGSAATPSDLIMQEWMELARQVDRLFFWLFMMSSVLLLTGLGMSIVQRGPLVET